MFDGCLIIDKPDGWTSHDVVGKIRKILRTKRIGHTGTLDPFATGVLVILVGKATRLAQFLDKDRKEYEAEIAFGFETDTGDRTGRQKAKGKRQNILVEDLENVLPSFRGEIWQTPPMYSAKKVEGKKLYELARKGIEIERQPLKVTIFELEILEITRHSALNAQDSALSTQGSALNAQDSALNAQDSALNAQDSALNAQDSTLNAQDSALNAQDSALNAQGSALNAQGSALNAQGSALSTQQSALSTQNSELKPQNFTLRVACSAGTYIRTLAEDIGKKLETGAHLAELRRTKAGKFDIEQAVTIEELENLVAEDRLDEIKISLNEAVSHLPQIVLSDEEILKTRNGQKVKRENLAANDGENVRLIDENENLLAIGIFRKNEKTVQPKIVLM